MFHLTDPTYLRYIFDGLESQSIQPENLAALPQGLVGIYEESIPAEQNVKLREKFLQFFSVWALLKKEVSASFVADLLNWKEQEVIDKLSTYTKWFNSPASGTYILYHERLRTYLLSKITSNQLKQTNQKIIESCQHALELKKGDEWETYALEHLPAHLLTPAMQDEVQGIIFRNLVYSTAYWNRQLEISKGYDWSKKMLNLAMVWAAKQNTDELIECALNKIDLHYMEQNDAPRIVELVAQNDIETALQRIEYFGGNDKEGLQRKFTLYMICLMELTLLDSKDKPFRKDSIEKLLNHLNENIPVDHSLLKWNRFISSFLMFQMACEWAAMGLDYLSIYKKSDKWESGWIAEKGPYNDIQCEVLYETARSISDESGKSDTLTSISTELAKLGKLEEGGSVMQESLECARTINDEWEKSEVLSYISTELAKQGKLEEALEYARGISNESHKSAALRTISTELTKQGKLEKGASVMQELLECALGINDEWGKSDALRVISTELAKQENLEESASVMQESLECARGINDEWKKSNALTTISTELVKQGRLEESVSVMQESLLCARGINDEWEKNNALASISTELAKQGKSEKALECAFGINDEREKSDALRAISTELTKQGNLEDALECAHRINYEWQKNDALRAISTELIKQGKLEEGASVMQESLLCVRGINDEWEMSYALTAISTELAKQGKSEEAFVCARCFNNEREKSDALRAISTELAKQGKLEESFECARGINDESQKSEALSAISTELVKQGKLEEGASVMQESLECARGINDESQKSEALSAISTELAKQGKLEEGASVMQESLLCARGINDEWEMSYALSAISTELAKQGKSEEAFVCARGINDESQKSVALRAISTELAKQGKLEEALECARGINNEEIKSNALSAISTELVKHGKIEEGTSVLQEALEFARGISDEKEKNRALISISEELAKTGNYISSEQTGLEINQIAKRHDCWRTIPKQQKDQFGLVEALKSKSKFQTQEAQSFYLKGWAESITTDDITDELAHLAIQALQHDSTSLENFLQVYAQHELFFGNPSQEKIDRLNKTLNLQWALDIIAQFPEE